MVLMLPSALLYAVELNSVGVQSTANVENKSAADKVLTFISNFQGEPGWRRPPKSIEGTLLSAQGSSTALVVLAENFQTRGNNRSNKYCLEPFARGAFNGEIVVCQQSDASTDKIIENLKAAGASGVIVQAMSLKPIDTDVTESFPSVSANLDSYFLLKNWVKYSEPGTAIATIGN